MTLASRIRGALKPEYVFQPRILARRLWAHGRTEAGKVRFAIPGGATIVADAAEEQGQILATLGVVDLPVTETLWRLTDGGETALDIGANIGYMSGVLGARVGKGHVHAFEAMPSIFDDLEQNVAGFRQSFPDVTFSTYAAAVSDRVGTVRMELPAGSDTNNKGLARVAASGALEVAALTLDGLFRATTRMGVMKLDVEGHESAVLRGAQNLFREHRVRDCVFEEHRPYPSDVTTWFEDRGYKIFRILRPLTGPSLADPASTKGDVDWLPQNFLATCDEARARERFGSCGWKCLGS